MQFYSPWILLCLAAVPLLIHVARRGEKTAAIRFPMVGYVKSCPVSWRLKLRPLLAVARVICMVMLIVALARPRGATVLSETSTEGVAIEVVVDRSSSMGTEIDYFGRQANRLECVKNVFADFIKGNRNFGGRSGDLVGMVTFARYAETVCPLVQSHNVLLEFLKNTGVVQIRSEDGTAIGDAVALAAARLKNAEEEIESRRKHLGLQSAGEGFKIKSKAIVLLTDGRNNTGQYDPFQAAELAGRWGIKI